MPKNGGNSDGFDQNGLKLIKVFELELSNMEGAPCYSLTHQLTIGSEIGNIVIADPSVSPRHTTFILQQEVVSVIDHGSTAGTLVNGKKIPTGRYIILEESDVINVGDLEVKINTRNEAVEAEGIPELACEGEDDSLESASRPEWETEEEGGTPVPSGMSRLMEVFKGKEVREQKSPEPVDPSNAANSLVRVVAVTLDLLLSYSIFVVFSPFDEFRNFLELLPGKAWALTGVEWGSFWENIMAGQLFIREMVSDGFQYFSGMVTVWPVLLIFVLMRGLTTLFLGVSLSELFLSIVPHGNKIWARAGGLVRVLVGAITGPFLIFDFPAVLSRRTFKETITFTRTVLKSKFIAILSTIFLVPAFVMLALVSPIFQGLELPEPTLVDDRIDQRVRVQPSVQGTETSSPVMGVSQFFHLDLSYHTDELTLMPLLKFKRVEKKAKLIPQMIFYHHELQRPVMMELMKTFDMRQLLGLGIKGNFPLYDKYPEIHSLVYQIEGGGQSFRPSVDAKAQTKFANEVMTFTKLAFELNPQNVLQAMEMDTPFIKGLIDFKSSFLELLEYKDFDQVGFIKLGNAIFMKVSYMKQKPFDLIIPLIKGEGRIYRIDYDKKENLIGLASKFYKYTLDKANWLELKPLAPAETLDAFQVIDAFSSQKAMAPETAQALYGYYYERSAEILRKDDPAELELWKKSVNSVAEMVEGVEAPVTVPGEEESPVLKLKQNFGDLKEAVESKNLDYFGVGLTQTI